MSQLYRDYEHMDKVELEYELNNVYSNISKVHAVIAEAHRELEVFHAHKRVIQSLLASSGVQYPALKLIVNNGE